MISDLAQERERMHLQARQMMAADDFHCAVEILVRSYQSLGPHVLSLVDLASSYYMLQDYMNFRKWTLDTFEEFKKVKSQLSLQSLQSAASGLGKLLEELGQMALALELYQSVSTYTHSTRFTEKTQAQILRLSCLMEDRAAVALHYLSRENTTWIDSSCAFDTQHALMHADCLVHGVAAASLRVTKMIRDQNVDTHSRRLIFFDFLFEALRKNQGALVSAADFEVFNYYACDSFEQLLWDLYRLDTQQEPLEAVTHLRSQHQSPACALRSLHLIQQREQLGVESETARSKFLFLSQALDPLSRDWVLRAWPLKTKSAVQLDICDDVITAGVASLNLKGQTVSRLLLQQLAESPQISTDALITQIYDLPMDDSTYGRLKTLVSRLNKNLEALCGTEKPIQLSKNQVSLKKSVQIRRLA